MDETIPTTVVGADEPEPFSPLNHSTAPVERDGVEVGTLSIRGLLEGGADAAARWWPREPRRAAARRVAAGGIDLDHGGDLPALLALTDLHAHPGFRHDAVMAGSLHGADVKERVAGTISQFDKPKPFSALNQLPIVSIGGPDAAADTGPLRRPGRVGLGVSCEVRRRVTTIEPCCRGPLSRPFLMSSYRPVSGSMELSPRE